MFELFTAFIKKEKLFLPNEKILLAVSGGIDSMVMCHLFHQAGFNFDLAHCNYQLRGSESNEDEEFVKAVALKYKVHLYSIRFDTAPFAETQDMSIQMAARELRYNWFEEIRNSYHYNFIATAHHQDDSIETFFINLIRGTGITGLHGILPKQGNIIRPLLFANKTNIIDFAEKSQLKFREDSSNASDKYLRNKIRHHIIPTLKEVNPSIENTLMNTIERLKDAETIVKTQVGKLRKEMVKQVGDTDTISIPELQILNPLSTYLFELLKPYQFNSSTSEEIKNALNGESGKVFYSKTHQVLKDRTLLIISKKKTDESTKQSQNQETKKKAKGLELVKLESKILPANMEIPQSPNLAALDYDKITFPLTTRKWKEGDWFYPLGMKGKKKLSDFFIDNKLSLNQKENTWLLTSADNIVWVIGMRIDNRFKVTDKTKKIYLVELAK